LTKKHSIGKIKSGKVQVEKTVDASSVACSELITACRNDEKIDFKEKRSGGFPLKGLPRVDCVAALPRIAKPGNRDALEACTERLADPDAAVRRAAVTAFAALAPGDRQLAVSKTCAQLEHNDWRVRAAARRALCVSVTEENDFGAINTVKKLLEHPAWSGRRGVAPTMQQLGAEFYGPQSVLQALLPQLAHSSWSVRRKAIEAIATVAKGLGGDKTATRYIGCQAWDCDEAVRLTVAACLPDAAPQRSREAISILMPLAFCDADVDVRCQAVQSIGQLATPGRSRSRMIVNCLCRGLEDNVASVRDVALRQIQAVCWGRRTAIDMLADRIAHKDDRVRKVASIAFRAVTSDLPERRRKRATHRTLKLLGHPEAGVRQAAAASMDSGGLTEADFADAAKAEAQSGDEADDPDSPSALLARKGTRHSTIDVGHRIVSKAESTVSRRSLSRRSTVTKSIPQPPNRAAVVQAAAKAVKRICLQIEQLEDTYNQLREQEELKSEVSSEISTVAKSVLTDAEKTPDDDDDEEEQDEEEGEEEDKFSDSVTDLDDDELEDQPEGEESADQKEPDQLGTSKVISGQMSAGKMQLSKSMSQGQMRS
jgi:hypothetical protein